MPQDRSRGLEPVSPLDAQFRRPQKGPQGSVKADPGWGRGHLPRWGLWSRAHSQPEGTFLIKAAKN